jgi:hypothetical protein
MKSDTRLQRVKVGGKEGLVHLFLFELSPSNGLGMFDSIEADNTLASLQKVIP